MVHDEIHAHIDAFVMAGRRQVLQILHGTQALLDFPEIRHCVAAIGAALRGLQERHQVDVVHIAFLDVIQPGLHALHVPGKIVDVEHHPQHVIAAVPSRVRLPGMIQFFQPGLPLQVKVPHVLQQFREHGVVPVQFHVKPAQLVVVLLQPGLELLVGWRLRALGSALRGAGFCGVGASLRRLLFRSCFSSIGCHL